MNFNDIGAALRQKNKEYKYGLQLTICDSIFSKNILLGGLL